MDFVTPMKITLQRSVQLEPYHQETFIVECNLRQAPDLDEAEALEAGFSELRILLNKQTVEAQKNWDDRNAGLW